MTDVKTTSVPEAHKPKRKIIPKVAPKTTPRTAIATSVKKVATGKMARPAAKVATKQVVVKKASAQATGKPEKLKKPKMVRDSFTMPKAEFAVLDVLKARATDLKTPTKKTEIIRAGIKALAAMSDVAFLAAVGAVPSLKTGRPAKSA